MGLPAVVGAGSLIARSGAVANMFTKMKRAVDASDTALEVLTRLRVYNNDAVVNARPRDDLIDLLVNGGNLPAVNNRLNNLTPNPALQAVEVASSGKISNINPPAYPDNMPTLVKVLENNSLVVSETLASIQAALVDISTTLQYLITPMVANSSLIKGVSALDVTMGKLTETLNGTMEGLTNASVGNADALISALDAKKLDVAFPDDLKIVTDNKDIVAALEKMKIDVALPSDLAIALDDKNIVRAIDNLKNEDLEAIQTKHYEKQVEISEFMTTSRDVVVASASDAFPAELVSATPLELQANKAAVDYAYTKSKNEFEADDNDFDIGALASFVAPSFFGTANGFDAASDKMNATPDYNVVPEDLFDKINNIFKGVE